MITIIPYTFLHNPLLLFVIRLSYTLLAIIFFLFKEMKLKHIIICTYPAELGARRVVFPAPARKQVYKTWNENIFSLWHGRELLQGSCWGIQIRFRDESLLHGASLSSSFQRPSLMISSRTGERSLAGHGFWWAWSSETSADLLQRPDPSLPGFQPKLESDIPRYF